MIHVNIHFLDCWSYQNFYLEIHSTAAVHKKLQQGEQKSIYDGGIIQRKFGFPFFPLKLPVQKRKLWQEGKGGGGGGGVNKAI